MRSVHSRLPALIRVMSDIPRPDNEVLLEILDHHFLAEDLRTELFSEYTLVLMKIDQQWNGLE
jgi:hypothetical protein